MNDEGQEGDDDSYSAHINFSPDAIDTQRRASFSHFSSLPVPSTEQLAKPQHGSSNELVLPPMPSIAKSRKARSSLPSIQIEQLRMKGLFPSASGSSERDQLEVTREQEYFAKKRRMSVQLPQINFSNSGIPL